ncbi:MAG: hypothetical protein KKA58_03390 [Nanoarchaeota archaeon]|nr:hypothetical protein [Nanoarchaeota archaeon]MBU1613572.1 hypothetical protein [Patescibacteria group bacterium]MBU1876134.1 hypothetical protein [Nanoarchaeota archaeon]
MTDIIKAYQDLLENECLPIQQQEQDGIDTILSKTGLCIIAGYHGSGKSSLARRYSHHRKPLRKVYCKNISVQDIPAELERDNHALFLDSVTDLLYDEDLFQAIHDRAKDSPVILGVHIEPRNINSLFREHLDNLIVVGSLNYEDARLLASSPLEEVPDKLLQYSGMRRRDLINLCIESYSVRGDFSDESLEEGTANLADKSQRVYQHIFDKHFTGKQRELIQRIFSGNATRQDDLDTEVLLKTGMIKENGGELTINGKLLELVFRRVLS